MSHILNIIIIDQQEEKTYKTIKPLVVRAEAKGILLDPYLKNINGISYLVMLEEENGYQCSCQFAYYSDDENQELILHFSKNQLEELKELFNELFNDSPKKCLIVYLETNRIITYPDEVFPADVRIEYLEGLKDFWEKHDKNKIVENTLYFVCGDLNYRKTLEQSLKLN